MNGFICAWFFSTVLIYFLSMRFLVSITVSHVPQIYFNNSRFPENIGKCNVVSARKWVIRSLGLRSLKYG